MAIRHVPVLLHEVIKLFEPRPGQRYIDATYGSGGHTIALLKRVLPTGRVLAIEADPSVVVGTDFRAQDPMFKNNLVLVNGNFADLADIAQARGFSGVSGVLFDLGLSSVQLDAASRGFSFQRAGPLDMRFDQSVGATAADIVNSASEAELARILRDYGEERMAKKLARAIVAQRSQQKIVTTDVLFQIVKHALPAALRFRASDVSRRVFQALRIAVNAELENLAAALPQALTLLARGGRLAVISFHSLEDRIVKYAFREWEDPCICPPDFPHCVCGRKSVARIVTRKPITAGSDELTRNPRAKSAKLRAIEKI